MLTDGESLLLIGLVVVTACAVVGMAIWITVLERRLGRARREARVETFRLLGELAASFAHSFNEVFTPIVGRAQLAARRETDPQIQQWLAMIERSALDGARIAASIQEATRLRRDDGAPPADLNAVVKDAIAATASRIPKGVQIKTRLGTPGSVRGDADGLRDAMIHVILNAVEAMPAGVITIITSGAAGEALVSVNDTGVGMAPDIQRRMFEPFFSTKDHHTGLGLSFVYGIVARHGGQVEVDSAPAKGTTVRLRLPTEMEATKPARELATAPPAPGGPRRCLLVDDDGDVRDMLRDVLVGGGYEVVTATDGSDGVDKFKREQFDLVITDFAMPRLNGLQLARTCKQLRPAVPILMLTGWEVRFSVNEFAEYGVDAMLPKPVRIDNILKAVAALSPLHPAPAVTPAAAPRET